MIRRKIELDKNIKKDKDNFVLEDVLDSINFEKNKGQVIDNEIFNKNEENLSLLNMLGVKEKLQNFYKNINEDKKSIKKYHQRTKSDFVFKNENWNNLFSSGENLSNSSSINKRKKYNFKYKNKIDKNSAKNSWSMITENTISNGNDINKFKRLNLENDFNNYNLNSNYYEEINFDFLKNFKNSTKLKVRLKNEINMHWDSINMVLFLNKKLIVSCSNDYLLKLYNLENKNKLNYRNSCFKLICMDFNKNLNKLVVGNDNGYILVYKLVKDTLKFKIQLEISKNNSIKQIISQKNNYFISNGINIYYSNNIKLGFKKLKNIKHNNIHICCFDNNKIILYKSNKFNWYDFENILIKKFFKLKYEIDNKIKVIQNLSNNIYLLGDNLGFINIFDNSINNFIYKIKGHQNQITSFILNENTSYFGTTSSDGYLRYWDSNNLKCLEDKWISLSSTKGITCSSFSDSNSLIVLGNNDGKIRFAKINI